MVRIYVALLSKNEQPKPVLRFQKLKTLFFFLLEYFGIQIFSWKCHIRYGECRKQDFGFFFAPIEIHL